MQDFIVANAVFAQTALDQISDEEQQAEYSQLFS